MKKIFRKVVQIYIQPLTANLCQVLLRCHVVMSYDEFRSVVLFQRGDISPISQQQVDIFQLTNTVLFISITFDVLS